jgi:hypothetical protein
MHMHARTRAYTQKHTYTQDAYRHAYVIAEAVVARNYIRASLRIYIYIYIYM